MNIKVLAVLGLAAVVGFGACKSATNTNTAMNTNVMNVAVATPTIAKTNEVGTTDPNLKPNIEKALKAKGFNDVTVDTSGAKMVVRGSVAKGKMSEMILIIQGANGGKPVDNQVTEK